MADKTTAIVDFLFEVGILSQTPRSWPHFLGSGKQSVAEHLNRATYIGYVLASMEGDVDMAKVLQMCLFHDLAEGRTSDLNYVHQKYTSVDEQKAIDELADPLPFGENIRTILHEYEERESKESIVAKDADNLEFILSLKEQTDIGNTRSKTWLPSAVARIKTKSGKKLAKKILETDSDHWWFADKDSEWWITRNGKDAHGKK
ncbi:MAG: HD domain-containing protein [Candidatus Andersenbacteria bacterium]